MTKRKNLLDRIEELEGGSGSIVMKEFSNRRRTKTHEREVGSSIFAEGEAYLDEGKELNEAEFRSKYGIIRDIPAYTIETLGYYNHLDPIKEADWVGIGLSNGDGDRILLSDVQLYRSEGSFGAERVIMHQLEKLPNRYVISHSIEQLDGKEPDRFYFYGETPREALLGLKSHLQGEARKDMGAMSSAIESYEPVKESKETGKATGHMSGNRETGKLIRAIGLSAVSMFVLMNGLCTMAKHIPDKYRSPPLEEARIERSIDSLNYDQNRSVDGIVGSESNALISGSYID